VSGALDVFADQFQLNVGPYGCAINFLLSSPEPTAPGVSPPAERQVTVRLSLEHLKMMAFVLRRQVREFERRFGVRVDVPKPVLNQLGISQEDWDACWSD
jgi:hypothetical protein